MKILKETTGYYCTRCNTLCSYFDSATFCFCDIGWKYGIEEYPEYWIKCDVIIKEKYKFNVEHEQCRSCAYWECAGVVGSFCANTKVKNRNIDGNCKYYIGE